MFSYGKEQPASVPGASPQLGKLREAMSLLVRPSQQKALHSSAILNDVFG